MIQKEASIEYSIQASLAYFVSTAPLVTLVALFGAHQPPLFFVAQAFVFLYIILTPGLFILPFLTKKKLPFVLGVTLSITLSILILMLAGLLINTALPWFGDNAPLTTLPLLAAFNAIIFILFALNARYKTDFILEIPRLNNPTIVTVAISAATPILAALGAISLNNGGSNFFTMLMFSTIAILVVVVIAAQDSLDESMVPIALYFMALAILLSNSLRGWYVTGHDILLEYHVFNITNTLHVWSMANYPDPYNACLSLTVLPTFLQQLLHIDGGFIFKLLFQFLGALPVMMIYYLSKRYMPGIIAFIAGFLYISFPSFMIDSPFLNRQGIAFVFFGAMLYAILTDEYFSGRVRTAMIFLFGLGMIFSHYSTSYVAIALLVVAYFLDRILRFIIGSERIPLLSRLTKKFSEHGRYRMPKLLNFPVILSLALALILWSGIITQTSTSVVTTINQIVADIEHPIATDNTLSASQYSVVPKQQPTVTTVLDQFVQQSVSQYRTPDNASNLFPAGITNQYPTSLLPNNEPLLPVTTIGQAVQSSAKIDLIAFYNNVKQAYAQIMQALLLIGLIGVALGYTFKRNLRESVPVEFIALSISGIGLMVGQTLLPASTIDYGLLRLFQQNLIILSIPISLGFLGVISLVIPWRKAQLMIYAVVLLGFFFMLSGFLPEITGGGRPVLSLNNSGLYYDAYYTHGTEISSMDWLATTHDPQTTIQSDHYFAEVKILAYTGIATDATLLPQTIERNSYVYLDHTNVSLGDVIEFIESDAIYYHFPLAFLQNNKSLIYNNGGSEIYR
jgi:uncharacterized membrane protein